MSKKYMTRRGEIREYAKGVGTVLLKLGQIKARSSFGRLRIFSRP